MKKIDLSYQKNVRDIGGLVGIDGKKVKYGKLYRGGFLGRLSKKDIEVIKSLHLTDVCDFRSKVEYTDRPDHKFKGVKYHNFPALVDNEELRKNNDYDDSNLLWFLGTNRNGKLHMVKSYNESAFSDVGIKAYKNFFKVLLTDKDRVVYFHCSQGKDRAGLASFFIEMGLGVSYHDALIDYLLSNEAMNIKLKQLKVLLKDKPFFDEEYVAALEDVFTADENYLSSVVTEINRRYGSVINYLKEVLEVDLDKLREYYLE